MLEPSDIGENLDRLEKLLLQLPIDAMSLSEADGLMCAVAVGPELVPTAEWLPEVWRGEPFDPAWSVDFAELSDLLIERYNAIVVELGDGNYAPLYDIDDVDQSILWEIWLVGFEAGMGLRLKAWNRLLRRGKDERAVDAAFGFVQLLAASDPKLPPDDPEVIQAHAHAPNAIPRLATMLYRAHAGRPAIAPVQTIAVGRNDPCPCGSGLKFKRCCGAT